MTAMPAAPDGRPNHYRAEDYDTLVDSPIVAGKRRSTNSTSRGASTFWSTSASSGSGTASSAAQELEKIVRETRRFWGSLPFRRYVFLNVFGRAAGGLEHKDSTLLTAGPAERAASRIGTLALVRQPRVFSRVQRQAAAARRAGPVRLREPAVDAAASGSPRGSRPISAT